MPGTRTKSSTKKTDHVQVQEIKQGGRAKCHWTVKVDKKTAGFTSKRKAEEAAAAPRADPAARQPETASAEDRTVAPTPEAQGASAPDTTTGEPEAQAAAPDTSAVAPEAVTQPEAVTHEDGDEIVQVGGGAGVQGVGGVESAEGVAGAQDVVVKLEPDDNLGDIKMKVVPEDNPVAEDSAAAQGSAVPADSAEMQDTQELWQSVADKDAAD